MLLLTCFFVVYGTRWFTHFNQIVITHSTVLVWLIQFQLGYCEEYMKWRDVFLINYITTTVEEGTKNTYTIYHLVVICICHQTSNNRRILVRNKRVDHSALLQLHLNSRLNIWLQWITQRQMETRRETFKFCDLVILIFRGLTVYLPSEPFKHSRSIEPYPRANTVVPRTSVLYLFVYINLYHLTCWSSMTHSAIQVQVHLCQKDAHVAQFLLFWKINCWENCCPQAKHNAPLHTADKLLVTHHCVLPMTSLNIWTNSSKVPSSDLFTLARYIMCCKVECHNTHPHS